MLAFHSLKCSNISVLCPSWAVGKWRPAVPPAGLLAGRGRGDVRGCLTSRPASRVRYRWPQSLWHWRGASQPRFPASEGTFWTAALPSVRKKEDEGIPLRAACGTPTPWTPACSSENGCSVEGSNLLPKVGPRGHEAAPEAEVGGWQGGVRLHRRRACGARGR